MFGVLQSLVLTTYWDTLANTIPTVLNGSTMNLVSFLFFTSFSFLLILSSLALGNVVFSRESSAFRALHNLSEPYESAEDDAGGQSAEEEEDEEEDNLVEMILSRAGEMPLVDYDDEAAEEEEKSPELKAKPKAKVPRESWRRAVGVPDRSELLLVRYAKAGEYRKGVLSRQQSLFV